jgi:hypothetical protein
MIAGIGGGLAVTRVEGHEAEIQLANLHGDVIGTVADNENATPKLTSEPTAFGVPTTSTPSNYSWLGTGGLQTEFASGVVNGGGGVYVPQLGLHLAPSVLSGSVSQDPVNEYLAGEDQAQPTGTRTLTLPGAIEPLPANAKVEAEFWEDPPWDKPPVNGSAEEGAESEGEEGVIEYGDPVPCVTSAPTPVRRHHGHLFLRGGYSCRASSETAYEESLQISGEVQFCVERKVRGRWYPLEGTCSEGHVSLAPRGSSGGFEEEYPCHLGSLYRVWLWVFIWGPGGTVGPNPKVEESGSRRCL